MSIKDDFDFFKRNKDKYNFSGRDVTKEVDILYSIDGDSAFECFKKYDTNGVKNFETSEPELLKDIINCKASINLHIRMYAQSMVEGTLFEFELQEISDNIKAPPWFIKSVINQSVKIIKNKTS